jgi:hypothetical protein
MLDHYRAVYYRVISRCTPCGKSWLIWYVKQRIHHIELRIGRHFCHSGPMKAHSFGFRANAPSSQKALNIGLLAVSFLFIVSLATSSAQTLTVNDGSGSGPHVAGEQVIVTADPPPPGQKFAGWSGDTQILANPSLSTTTATMPSIDVTISATYAETADRQTSIATATASPSPSPTPSPGAQSFFSIFDGAVRLRSATSTQEVPAYGHIGVASLLLEPPQEGTELEVSELAIDIPSEVPPGSLHVVIEHGVLTVTSDGSARGDLQVRVSLPLHDLEFSVVATGVLLPTRPPFQFRYRRFDLQFVIQPEHIELDPIYRVRLLATLAQETVTRDEIDRLIAELDDDDIEVRARAQLRLLQIGRPALRQVEGALPGVSEEQRLRLLSIISQIRSVTTAGIEWIGDGVGVYVARFTVHVPSSGKAWTKNVHDVHFIVGTPMQSAINHSGSTVTLQNFPQGWVGVYDPEKGEYLLIKPDQAEPLTPCTEYLVEIRTGATVNPGGNPVDKLGDMSWYYTDKAGRKIGDAGRTQGLVFRR